MNQKKIINALVILIALAAVTYFIVQRNHAPSSLGLNPQVGNGTAGWKTYRSEKYKFEIKYPTNLEPLEGQALFYRPPEFSPLLNVCFASVNRKELYCEAELYIAPSFVAGPQNLTFSSANSFLGIPRCAVEGLPPPSKFDGVQGVRVDTCGKGGTRVNAFVTTESFLYLLSTEPSVGYTTRKDATFQGMIDSFNFINP